MNEKAKKADCHWIKEIIGDSELVDSSRSKLGGGFRFSVYLSKEFVESDIESLDLSVRASNCLKRAGILTVGDLCRRVDRSSDLKTIRNCGYTSIIEIMDKLFYYNYMCLKPEKRDEYVLNTIKQNSGELVIES